MFAETVSAREIVLEDCFPREIVWEIVFAWEIVCGCCSERLFGGRKLFAEICRGVKVLRAVDVRLAIWFRPISFAW